MLWKLGGFCHGLLGLTFTHTTLLPEGQGNRQGPQGLCARAHAWSGCLSGSQAPAHYRSICREWASLGAQREAVVQLPGLPSRGLAPPPRCRVCFCGGPEARCGPGDTVPAGTLEWRNVHLVCWVSRKFLQCDLNFIQTRQPHRRGAGGVGGPLGLGVKPEEQVRSCPGLQLGSGWKNKAHSDNAAAGVGHRRCAGQRGREVA